jgi:hypothetical protein
LALIRDLEARLSLDRPPGQHLYDLSTVELIDLAKRVVHGPHTWRYLCRTRSIISHKIVLRPVLSDGSEMKFQEPKAILLPGGRFVLTSLCRTSVECWNVEEERLVWRHEGQERGYILNFAADMVDNGQAAVILIFLKNGDLRRYVRYFLFYGQALLRRV